MNALVATVGSTRAMLACFVALGAALVLPSAHDAWSVPLALGAVALNLAAAIIVHPRLRRGGLGVFHVSLLAFLLAAACGQLARYEGEIEIVEGGAFEPEAVITTRAGALHAWGIGRDAFLQGPWTVDYEPGVKRAHTRSGVLVAQGDGSLRPLVIGDDTPLGIGGYRFYTTHNKGFAAIVTWLPEGSEPATGALHFPSYPMFDWRQEARFDLPGQGEARLFLQLDAPLDESARWTLEPAATPASLVVHVDGRREVLRPGDATPLPGGRLRFDRLAGWMGYRVFRDPALPWLFALAALAVAGLAWHVWRRAAIALPLATAAIARGGT